MMDKLIALAGAIVGLSIFVINNAFRLGHHSARLESLESWRANIRIDMHEISEKLEVISDAVRELKTIVEERTERRITLREKN